MLPIGENDLNGKIMKKLIVLVLGLYLGGESTLMAQTVESKSDIDTMEVMKEVSIYTEFVKQKNFGDALPAWRYVYTHAPAFQLNTYLRGEDIMIGIYQSTKNHAYIDTLMMLYDNWIKYFGNQRYSEGYILGKKGASLYRFGRPGDETLKEAYGYMRKSFDLEGARTNEVTAQMLFHVAGEMLKKEFLAKDQYIDLYTQLSACIEEGIKNGGRTKDRLVAAKERVDAMFYESGAADCATLNRLLTVRYEANKADTTVLKEIVSLLRRSECVDLPLYATVTEELYRMNPSGEAAYSLAIMFLRRQDFAKTETYLREAIAKSKDGPAKADYCLRLAQVNLSKGQLQEAKRNASETLRMNPNLGQALIVIGKAYGLYRDYGKDDFEHRMVFWVAVDKFQRAKQVDPGVAAEAGKLIDEYSQHFPSKDDAFFRGIKPGDTVKLGDWINETTIARFNK